MNAVQPSLRAQIVEHRTYLRPLNDEGTVFETPEQAIDRMIAHQKYLWQRAKAGFKIDPTTAEYVLAPLTEGEEAELRELRDLMLDRRVTLAGRTRWLGGTAIARTRESSQFNCSFLEVRTVHDVVDVLWLLLQGCGVGFRPVVGNLNGFAAVIPEIEIVRSTMTIEQYDAGERGEWFNTETFDDATGVWTIKVGDSAESWAKSVGKLLAGKRKATKLVFDFSNIRPAGIRLKGYGWISSGDEAISKAYYAIAQILNKRAGELLSRIDILDIVNWLGTILSSRRSAQIALQHYGDPEWQEFAKAKHEFWNGNPQRAQSNNSLVFWKKPTKRELKKAIQMMIDAGGSEPGFINGEAALKRAPWFKGVNPCAEILLGDRSFCNLVETVLFRFNGDEKALHRAHYIVARANYRQTCVNLDDGLLQRGWHELNEFLRLCGVGVTGVVAWEYANEADAWQDLATAARSGANSMADELGLPRAKAITTIKPSGTQSKTMGLVGAECPEGIHKPLGRFLFNNVGFSKHDPLVEKLRKANYHVRQNPYDTTGVLVRLPVEFSNIPFEKIKRTIRRIVILTDEEIALSVAPLETVLGLGPNDKILSQEPCNCTVPGQEFLVEQEVELEVNLESAVDQLERYALVQRNYVDHNCSITVSYDPSEAEDIVDWLIANWDIYVGVSFLFRNDPTKTAQDLGYAYLPQEVVDQHTFHDYARRLKPVDLHGTDTFDAVDAGDECKTGACPVR